MVDIAKIMDSIELGIIQWHEEALLRSAAYEIVNNQIKRIRPLNEHRNDLYEVVTELVKTNAEMWHEEDKVRSDKNEVVLKAIRNINPLNQHRNDLIEEIDEIFMEAAKGGTSNGECRKPD